MDNKKGTANIDQHRNLIFKREKLLSRSELFARVFPLLLIWGLISACNLVGNPQNPGINEAFAAQTSTALAVQGVLDNLSVFATQTAQVIDSSGAPSTATPLIPTATNLPFNPTPIPVTQPASVVSEKIFFRKGGTSAYFQKYIKEGDQHMFTVRAEQGQTLILTASSPENDVYLGVKGIQDGEHLLRESELAPYWFGLLPKTQDYLITLTTLNPDTYYFFSAEIPANIRFQPGAYTASIDGHIEVDTSFHPDVFTRVRYLAFAAAGQTMTVELNSSNLDALSFGIVGQQDGQAYIRYQVKNNGGDIALPLSQGYYLDVYSTSGQSADFRLDITIK